MFRMPQTLPEPTSTVTRNGKYGYHQQVRRDVTSTWVLNPEAEGVPQVRVTLTTSHGESWRSYQKTSGYSSTMTWGTFEPAEPGSVFSVETWSSDNKMVRLHSTEVTRHSLKAMEAHHAEALEAAETHFDQYVKAVFAEAAERSGLNEMAEA